MPTRPELDSDPVDPQWSQLHAEGVVRRQLDPPLPPQRADDTPPPATLLLPADAGQWCYRGATLLAGDDGVVPLGQLERFIAWVRAEMPEALVRIHENGVRAVDMEGTAYGPYLDWQNFS